MGKINRASEEKSIEQEHAVEGFFCAWRAGIQRYKEKKKGKKC
jgi:hypothetical protein